MCKHPEEPAGDAHKAADAAEAAPYDAASLWSRLTYRYALPLFRIGVAKPLQIDDLAKIATRDELPDVTRRIVEAWELESQTKAVATLGAGAVHAAGPRPERSTFLARLWRSSRAGGVIAPFRQLARAVDGQ